MIRRYIQKDFKLIEFPKRVPRLDLRKITNELKEYLLDDTTLRKWALHSLNERCKRIRDRFGILITHTTLQRFYKQNGIRPLKPQYSYAHNYTENDILVKQ